MLTLVSVSRVGVPSLKFAHGVQDFVPAKGVVNLGYLFWALSRPAVLLQLLKLDHPV